MCINNIKSKNNKNNLQGIKPNAIINQQKEKKTIYYKKQDEQIYKVINLAVNKIMENDKKYQHIFITRHGARIDNGPDCDINWLQNSNHNRKDDPHISKHGINAANELGK